MDPEDYDDDSEAYKMVRYTYGLGVNKIHLHSLHLDFNTREEGDHVVDLFRRLNGDPIVDAPQPRAREQLKELFLNGHGPLPQQIFEIQMSLGSVPPATSISI